MAKRYHLTEIHRLKQRRIFFDTNILIYLFWPTQSHWEAKYATVYQHLLKQKNEMVVDFMVISEFVNRLVRIEYQKYFQQNNSLTFKTYRDSQNGQEALSDIYLIVKKSIINTFNVVGKIFNKSDIEHYLENDGLDFTDKALVTLCKAHDLVLLTNDKDFAAAELDILTLNPELLITP